MTDAHLSLEQAIAAAGADPDGRAHCPACNPEGIFDTELRLTISHNGDGPNRAHLQCSHGCAEPLIAGHLRRQLPDAGGSTLAALRKVIGLPISRVIKHGRRGDAYDLELDDGRVIRLGNAADLLSRTKFKAAIAGQADVVPAIAAKDFDHTINGLLSIAEQRDNVDDDQEETLGWIASYLNRAPVTVLHLDDPESVFEFLEAGDRPPFTTPDGAVGVFLRSLRMYIQRELHDIIPQKQLCLRLADIGFTRPVTKNVAARRGDTTRGASYWLTAPHSALVDEVRRPRSRVSPYKNKTRSISRGNNGNTETSIDSQAPTAAVHGSADGNDGHDPDRGASLAGRVRDLESGDGVAQHGAPAQHGTPGGAA